MRSQETFRAWRNHAREALRLSRIARETGDYSKVYPCDAEGQRLWEACVADGWTQEEGERALRDSKEE